uniref:Kelch like family member 8 n=1 Tax=Gopherus evgoodei TaxID=1825980 RepID=A0A8C4VE67_9SAUR
MASESMTPESAKHYQIKGKKQQQQQDRSLNSNGEEVFVFEANEAWKDFHSSLLHFYEAGELCDVTLKNCLCLPVPEDTEHSISFLLPIEKTEQIFLLLSW